MGISEKDPVCTCMKLESLNIIIVSFELDTSSSFCFYILMNKIILSNVCRFHLVLLDSVLELHYSREFFSLHST